jgi:ribonucleoside-diphosphate reductase beta chain
MKKYAQVFKPTEIQMMLSAFSNMETVHVAAYSHLLDTIGMPEAEYEAFLHYKEMKDKYDYMQQWGVSTPEDVLKTLAVFGGFTEGLQLFASFAMLLNFPRFNKMKGMGQIITWSVRDETLHTNSIVRLFHEWKKEFPQAFTPETEAAIYEACATIVSHEEAFIKLAFEMGDVEGLGHDAVASYIRYIANRRLSQLGLRNMYPEISNPLPWMDDMLNGIEHANFFETRATEYSKAATKGSWDDVF